MFTRILPALLLASGCYGYYPATKPTPVGGEVQLTLSDSGAVVLSRQIGPSAEAIKGRFAADSANTYVMAVTGVRQRSGTDVDWKGERVVVPRPLIVKVEERRFSRARTAVFTGVTVIGLVTLRQALGGEGFSFFGNGRPGTTGPK